MKIYIIGAVASGKTSLAHELSLIYNIPCYQGDYIAWGFPGQKRYKRSKKEQQYEIEKINKNEDWIIEGTLRDSQKMLLDMSEKIIYLDTPVALRKRRIVKRFIRQKFKIEKANYEVNMDMLKHMFKWTKEFEQERKDYEKALKEYDDKVIWVMFEDDKKKMRC